MVVGRVSGTQEWRLETSNGTSFTDTHGPTYSSSLTIHGAVAGNFFNFRRETSRALQYAYANISNEAYAGQMKGPEATLETKAGNDWDQAALLADLLMKVEIQGGYVYRQVTWLASDVCRWLGTKDVTAAFSFPQAVDPNHIEYDSFGNILSQTNSAETPRYAFAGRERDVESGLYYNVCVR
jgi:hypothetical protein